MSSIVLEARGLTAGYGEAPCVRDVDLKVQEGEIVALLGPNGAGKTTTLLAVAGALAPMGGEIRWMGCATRAPLHRRVRQGMSFVPEGKSVLMGLSVRDNLLLGRGRVEPALDLFPELGPLLNRRAGLLSGGEQQMLTLGRALAVRPAALLVDELSLGLAPILVIRLIEALRSAARNHGISVLLVEQQARRVVAVADRWYLLRNGRMAAEGDATAASLLEQSYLSDSLVDGDGLAGGDLHS
jgi:branched-chain amino acid transport system ATP-binding protein